MNTDYNFWRDLFDTYQSFSQIVQILWLIVPPTFVLLLTALALLRPGRNRKRVEALQVLTSHGPIWVESLQACGLQRDNLVKKEANDDRRNSPTAQLLPWRGNH